MFFTLTLAVLATVLSLLLTPLVRDVSLRLGLVDHPDKLRKLHSHPIPRVGGIAIALAYALAFAGAAVLPGSFGHVIVLDSSLPTALHLVPGALLVFFVGLYDDLQGLRPMHKLAG